MERHINLDTPVQFIKGVGPRKAEALAEAGVRTVQDLLYRLPFRYEDRSRIGGIPQLRPGEAGVVLGTVAACGTAFTPRRRMLNYELTLDDGKGQLQALWFNQPYLSRVFQRGQKVILYGVPQLRGMRGRAVLQMENPDFEIMRAGEDPVHMGGIVPVYERIGDLYPKTLRSIMRRLVDALPERVPELLPPAVASTGHWMPRRDALACVHFPPADASVAELNAFSSPAHQRLIFEEFFVLQCGLLLRKGAMEHQEGIAMQVNDAIRGTLRKILPFHLTKAQRRVLKEIASDMQRPIPMHRLLQGDVGSGKTIVALLAMALAVENGWQAALMAPTEILAEQHYRTIRERLQGTPYRVVLLTGQKKRGEKKTALQALEFGDAHIAVGTHAVIQEGVRLKRLGLAVVDEQHRFGVLQRAHLTRRRAGEGGAEPHVLVMTATPIPRSLALTLYGDLDVSVIDELPPGRKAVTTRAVGESRRSEVYDFMKKEIAKGGQAYVVYPLIEESMKLADVKAAARMAEHLQRDVFPSLRLALLHGRMKSEEKDAVMRRFKDGEIDVLVSTTVIEVGVDVPNASVMLVENAERFGLAQLHQLRGRVGRGTRKSFCILLHGERLTEDARMRMDAMVRTQDGFKIAETDLQIRGPGDFFGTSQSGMMPLRVANLLRDQKLLQEAREKARAYLDSLSGLPGERRRVVLSPLLAMWEGRLDLMTVG
jgi:ATP-dependent DNA helicase RecG